jgi:hypothetical protein
VTPEPDVTAADRRCVSVQYNLDDDWIQEHEKQLVVLEGEKIRQKFEKENAKPEGEGEKPLPEKELTERLKAADELKKTIKRDRKNGYEETKMSEERIVAALKKMDERIQVAKLAATDKDEGKGAFQLSPARDIRGGPEVADTDLSSVCSLGSLCAAQPARPWFSDSHSFTRPHLARAMIRLIPSAAAALSISPLDLPNSPISNILTLSVCVPPGHACRDLARNLED